MDTKKCASAIKEKIEQLTEKDFKLTHAYEVLATAHGHRNWHVMKKIEECKNPETVEIKEVSDAVKPINSGRVIDNVWKTKDGYVNNDLLEDERLYDDYYTLNLESILDDGDYEKFDKIHFKVKEQAIAVGEKLLELNECENFSVEYVDEEGIFYVYLHEGDQDLGDRITGCEITEDQSEFRNLNVETFLWGGGDSIDGFILDYDGPITFERYKGDIEKLLDNYAWDKLFERTCERLPYMRGSERFQVFEMPDDKIILEHFNSSFSRDESDLEREENAAEALKLVKELNKVISYFASNPYPTWEQIEVNGKIYDIETLRDILSKLENEIKIDF